MKNIRYYVFWGLDLLKGGPIKKHYQEIKTLMDSGDISKWQQEKITSLLDTASRHCRFYKGYDKYKSLNECPVIDKTTIKEHYEQFISEQYEKNSLHKMSTSGSTGTPFEILQNQDKRTRVLAELIYYNETAGQYVGDKFIFYRVWTDKNKKSKMEQIKQNLLPIDILHLDDNNLKYITDILLKDKKVNSTLAYASTYDCLLQYLRKNKIKGNFHVKSMISSSELLLDETRDGLEEIIGCKVINRYSNQECGVLAQSNLKENKMIINKASYFIEVLKVDADEPAEEGELGRIIVTDLFNYAMPLIRYDTGDLGIVSKNSSDAGYHFDNIQGRRVDIIYDTKGDSLTPHTWSVYMWKFNQLKQYQFIQEGEKEYTLKVNGAEGIYTEKELSQTLQDVLGRDAQINIDHVEEIPVLASGKFKKTICNYKKGENIVSNK